MRLAKLMQSCSDTVIAEATQPIQPDQDQTVNVRPSQPITTNQQQSVTPQIGTQNYDPRGLGDWSAVQKMRQDRFNGLPIDKKLEVAIKQSKTAQSFAAQALRSVQEFDRKLDQVFKGLSDKIDRLATGKPAAADQHEPGSSIWDDDGQDSILGR